MKTAIKSLAFTASLSMVVITAWADSYSEWELEPCINGEVSSSGLFPTQAHEDAYNTLMTFLEHEPCVVALGLLAEPARFPTSEMEVNFQTMRHEAVNRC
ncbi:hypothetical protein [Sedimenticola sp.]|uniref:hypothetical protein n=1 Tax=Sedimenticola sp. TaxID=1940285 RepID=UPI002582AE47|nr:hypothetical protein [Sedimenticola sp.]MCW8903419.1 hypothetical protein [Sedimenticola sp.]